MAKRPTVRFLAIASFFLFLFCLFFITRVAYALELTTSKQKATSAVLASLPISYGKEDSRVGILEAYLKSYNSPLAQNAKTFVATADKYNLDWRFVAAISGVESTFGHQIPYGTYNAWGWGIYGDNMYWFASFDEGIEIISKGLREQYINEWGAQDTYQIGRIYAASPTWASRVEYFMQSIKEFELKNPAISLSLSI